MTICAACKQKLDQDSTFCDHCGFRAAALALSPLDEEFHPQTATDESPTVSPSGHPSDAQPDEDPTQQSLPTVTARLAHEQTYSGQQKPPPSLAVTADQLPAVTVDEVPLITADELPAVSVEAPPPPAVEQPPPAPTQPDGPRRSQRFVLKADVTYTSEHNFYTGFLQNISDGGLFVGTHDLVPIGETVSITFTIPGVEGEFNASCEVRWVREHNPDNPDMIAGMGLVFRDLRTDAANAIDAFIKHREPIFFDD